jgi:hypothetical protein
MRAEDAEKIFLISLRLGGSAVARAGDAHSGAEACAVWWRASGREMVARGQRGDGGGGTGFTTETRRDLKFALAVSCIRAWAQNQNREGAEEAKDAEKIFLISLRLGGSAGGEGGRCPFGRGGMRGLAAGFGPRNGRVRAAGDGGGGTGIHHRGAEEAGPANPAGLRPVSERTLATQHMPVSARLMLRINAPRVLPQWI